MSATHRPTRSVEANTSDSDGTYAPGKMYLRMNGPVAPGGAMRPIACTMAKPSGVSRLAILAK